MIRDDNDTGPIQQPVNIAALKVSLRLETGTRLSKKEGSAFLQSRKAKKLKNRSTDSSHVWPLFSINIDTLRQLTLSLEYPTDP
jgi:hypothetical protein